MRILTVANVKETFEKCFYSGRIKTKYKEEGIIIVVQGALSQVAFRSDRVNKYRQDIQEMLYQLPNEFLQEKGGNGETFLKACLNYRDEQWTELSRVIDMLYTLGQAIGKIKTPVPKEFWRFLPKNMPVFIVLK